MISKRALIVLALLGTTILASCQTIPTSVPSDTAKAIGDLTVEEICDLYPPITWSSQDTQLTRDQVRAFNRARQEFCND